MAQRRHQLEAKALPPFDYEEMVDEICQINKQLVSSFPNARGQRDYITRYAMGKIQDQFDAIKDKGYNFSISDSKKGFYDYQSEGYVHEINRVVKLRFRCKNNRCPDFIKNQKFEKERKWTSYYGLTQLQMYFDNELTLRYKLKIYGQKCFACNEYGNGGIIQSTMSNLTKLYGIVLELILNLSQDLASGLELTKNQRQGQKQKKPNIGIKNSALKHREDLCEACLYGKCYYSKVLGQEKARERRRRRR